MILVAWCSPSVISDDVLSPSLPAWRVPFNERELFGKAFTGGPRRLTDALFEGRLGAALSQQCGCTKYRKSCGENHSTVRQQLRAFVEGSFFVLPPKGEDPTQRSSRVQRVALCNREEVEVRRRRPFRLLSCTKTGLPALPMIFVRLAPGHHDDGFENDVSTCPLMIRGRQFFRKVRAAEMKGLLSKQYFLSFFNFLLFEFLSKWWLEDWS